MLPLPVGGAVRTLLAHLGLELRQVVLGGSHPCRLLGLDVGQPVGPQVFGDLGLGPVGVDLPLDFVLDLAQALRLLVFTLKLWARLAISASAWLIRRSAWSFEAFCRASSIFLLAYWTFFRFAWYAVS
jgi:hypothetical protein